MRPVSALRSLLIRFFRAVGLEGAFLAAGTAALAVGSSFFSPAGPWLVVGAVGVLLGLALAVPRST
jgi:hypothetical protein